MNEDTAVHESGAAATTVSGVSRALRHPPVSTPFPYTTLFRSPGSLAGVYGTYTFDTITGAWTYTLNQSLADPLIAGQVVHDHLVVGSADAKASSAID